jgi:hypothetical protein
VVSQSQSQWQRRGVSLAVRQVQEDRWRLRMLGRPARSVGC